MTEPIKRSEAYRQDELFICKAMFVVGIIVASTSLLGSFVSRQITDLITSLMLTH